MKKRQNCRHHFPKMNPTFFIPENAKNYVRQLVLFVNTTLTNTIRIVMTKRCKRCASGKYYWEAAIIKDGLKFSDIYKTA